MKQKVRGRQVYIYLSSRINAYDFGFQLWEWVESVILFSYQVFWQSLTWYFSSAVHCTDNRSLSNDNAKKSMNLI